MKAEVKIARNKMLIDSFESSEENKIAEEFAIQIYNEIPAGVSIESDHTWKIIQT